MAGRRGIMLLGLLAVATAAGAQPDFPYREGFGDRLLHVHPEVNYSQHPEWQAQWERSRLGEGAFRGTFGSSSTDQLLVDADWTLNPRLTPGGLRFRNDIDWRETRHLYTDRLDLWLGLEQTVWRGLGVVAQGQVAEAKETIDVRGGGIWTSPDRTQYVQILYLAEDVVADEKDDREPVTDQPSQGVVWALRLAHGPWSLYSEGRWTTGSERRFPDAEASPDLRLQDRTANEFVIRGRWQPAPRAQVELSWQQYEDHETLAYQGSDDVYDHSYAGWYRSLGVRGLLPLAERWRLRGELHRLDRRASVTGWGAFSYDRGETMPGVWGEWSFGARHWLELGYMGTVYRWQEEGEPEESGYADKVELAVVLGFENGAGIKVSLSHEVSLEKFGGGSVRMITAF